ncbi:MAG TPA: glycosyltransferase [Candidatus Polarisedimenticolia bacterium]|nr:glycosyltransferase [Candidatus Polarisedimenticolia bacterium]
MLENLSIVCFAHDWHGDPTSKTHIMRILARRNRVLWVNSIGMRRPRASSSDFGRLAAKLRQGLSPCREVERNLFVAHPLVLPFPGLAAVDSLNARLLTSRLRSALRRHGFGRPVIWSFLPTMSRLLGRLGESMVIYHCVDEYAAFSGVPREALVRMEKEVARRADVVLTSSEQLCLEKRRDNENTHFVPHGVDVEHFGRALDPLTRVPEDIRWLPRPVIGFFGLLADWVDLDLILSLARARRGWSFALIGKATTDVSRLRGEPNVFLLGQKPYDALPGYCRGIDVGIIPFRLNDLTLRANPLKLREYLAAGLPVVATPLPEVRRFHESVRLAYGLEGFLEGIEAALDDRSEEAMRRRALLMQVEGWEARVAQISELIGRRMGKAA